MRVALDSDRLADCEYGGHQLCAAVQRDNVVATQFHPERSGEAAEWRFKPSLLGCFACCKLLCVWLVGF